MADDRERTPTEQYVRRSFIDETGVGKPLSERALRYERTVESYLKGQVLPRYIARAREIEKGVQDHEERLAEAYAQLREACAGDAARFAREWRATAERWDFAALNLLVRQHNEYYPIERNLPVDPRTGEYVKVSGRDFRRHELTPTWVLERFPAAR